MMTSFFVRNSLTFGLVLSTVLGGCAVNDTRTVFYFERLEIVALPPGEDGAANPSGGKSVAGGAATGALGGAMVSVLGSLLCGPLFAACFAAIAPATIGATTVAGGVMGASRLTPEDAEKVSRYFEILLQSHNLSEELATAVSAQYPASTLEPSEVADARLSLGPQSLGIASSSKKKLSFLVGFATRLDWDLDQQTPKHASRNYNCVTPVLPVEDWLADNGSTIEQELNSCIEDLATQISRVLKEPPPILNEGFGENSI